MKTNDGFTIAQAVHTALTTGNANGYVYWFGASTSTTRAVHPARRCRFIRPEATRIGATTGNGNLRLSAYRNPDGSLAVVALNAGGGATSVSYAPQNTGITNGTATPYLTNASNNTAAQAAIGVSGGSFTATVPGRSLVTYVIRSGGPSPSPSASPTPSPSGGCGVIYSVNAWNTGLVASLTLTIANAGSAPVTGWSLAFTLPAGQTVANGWNATYNPTSGQVTAQNMSYNATIPANGSVDIGFQATHTGNPGRPASFTLNGTTCTVV